MKRKVTKMGPASLVVSLPSKWAKNNNISKGDEVEVTENKRSLIINIGKIIATKKSIILDIPTKDLFLRRLFCTPYVQGVNEIRVNYNEKEVFELIKNKALELLFGFEIIKQESNSCVLKNISSGLESDFDIISNRIMFSVSTMFKEMEDAFKTSNFDALNNISAMEINNNKLTYLCLRTLNLKGYKDHSKSRQWYIIISEIEQIVDNLRDICVYINSKKQEISPTVKKVFSINRELFSDFHNLLKKSNVNEIINFEKKNKNCKKIISESKNELLMYYLLNITDKLSHISREIEL
jgi:phosphate uptake regulator